MAEQLTNDELGRQLAAQLMGSDLPLSLDGAGSAGGTEASTTQDNPLETDFFRAINAYRAARAGGDSTRIAEAERHLQDVVRGELAGEDCTS